MRSSQLEVCSVIRLLFDHCWPLAVFSLGSQPMLHIVALERIRLFPTFNKNDETKSKSKRNFTFDLYAILFYHLRLQKKKGKRAFELHRIRERVQRDRPFKFQSNAAHAQFPKAKWVLKYIDVYKKSILNETLLMNYTRNGPNAWVVFNCSRDLLWLRPLDDRTHHYCAARHFYCSRFW